MSDKPTDIRTDWFHYPIIIPLDKDGLGPATIGKDAVKISYEVWDRHCISYASFTNLADAINEAIRLNKEMKSHDT